jgi:phospholipid/cholesterol/gamma-HCH transport system substrate-binding protein
MSKQMQTRTVEIWVGLFIVAGMAALFFLSMKVSNLNKFSSDDGYRVMVHFENIGGLKVRSPVSVSGVRVGRVEAIEYDMNNYEALVTLKIDNHYNTFPSDTSASIFTSGLLGEQYVSLEPGGSDDYLKEGDMIRIAQSAVIMEQIIGQFLFDKAAE